jgi:flagellar protein FlaJ
MRLNKTFKSSLLASILLGSVLIFLKFNMIVPFVQILTIELIFAISLTPLIAVGILTFKEEQNILRKETNFLGFLPSLGSISTMRGGKITESVYYLSEKDYGILTKHVRDLYRRLRTRIDDDDAWEWFGVDTGSNYVQRSSEMFREATYAAANPRKTAKMISENMRKIRDLRVKKLTIINTSIALFAGITFGIAFSIYISLVIGEHLNNIVGETVSSAVQTEATTGVGANILSYIPPEMYANTFIIVFIVMIIHCFILSLTLKAMRGSHTYVIFLFFVPFVWIVAITSFVVQLFLSGMLTA